MASIAFHIVMELLGQTGEEGQGGQCGGRNEAWQPPDEEGTKGLCWEEEGRSDGALRTLGTAARAPRPRGDLSVVQTGSPGKHRGSEAQRIPITGNPHHQAFEEQSFRSHVRSQQCFYLYSSVFL